MARALGIDQRRMYSVDLRLRDRPGGVRRRRAGADHHHRPVHGAQFVAPAFITVVVGGTYNIITGTLFSAGALTAVKTPVGMFLGSFAGTVGLFLAALLLIRLCPNGLSSIRLFRS